MNFQLHYFFQIHAVFNKVGTENLTRTPAPPGEGSNSLQVKGDNCPAFRSNDTSNELNPSSTDVNKLSDFAVNASKSHASNKDDL